MRKVSDFLARKGGTTTFGGLPAQSRSANRSEEDGKPTFADIGARIGEENELLRNLLIDTGHQFSAIDDLKETFGKIVEPLNKTLRTLEQEKSDNVRLRASLAEIRASHEALRTEFQALEKNSAELESDNGRLRRELAFAQQSARELESNKAELGSELASVRVAKANLESQLAEESTRNRALSEENRILIEHANTADKRIVELEAEAAFAREKLSLLENDKSSLQAGLDQTLGETLRLSHGLTESASALTAARSRLEQTENSLAAAEDERKKLAAACDESNDRRQAEVYALNLKLDAMRSRAATAEKLLAEVRQSLVARTEQIRASERKLVEATVARSDTEKKVERLSALAEAQGRQIKELEQVRSTLAERCNVLSETVKGRESSLAHAQEQIKSLTERVDQLEFDAAANRAKTEKRIEDLNAAIQRERVERAVAEGALQTTRRDHTRLQSEMLAERAMARRGAPSEETSDAVKSKEPPKSKNGKGAGRSGKAADAKPDDGEIEPMARP